MLLLLSLGFSLSFLQIFLLLCTSPFFSLQNPSLGLDHSLLWMAMFLLLCEFCYCMQILLFLTNLATALVYDRWRPSDIVLTPGLSSLSTYLFEGDRLSRVLSAFPTSYSTLLSDNEDQTLIKLGWVKRTEILVEESNLRKRTQKAQKEDEKVVKVVEKLKKAGMKILREEEWIIEKGVVMKEGWIYVPKGQLKEVRRYIEECDVCQQYKNKSKAPVGKLIPNAIPEKPWSHILADFITKLPLA